MNCRCPDGYTLNNLSGLCERLLREDAVLSDSPVLPPLLCTNALNMRHGTAIYPQITSTQFPLTGVPGISPSFIDSSSTSISPQLYLLSGNLWISSAHQDRGRLNQAGIGLLPPTGEWQGYSRCITVAEDDVYSVAISATYGFRLYVDGKLAVYYVPPFPAKASDYLHIFPLVLSAGDHNILFEGISSDTGPVRQCGDSLGGTVLCTAEAAVSPPADCPNLGSFVCEIFLNVTPQMLSDAQDQFDLNKLYAKHSVNGIEQSITTMTLAGSPTDTGPHGNYTCSRGTISGCTEGKMVCEYLDTVSFGTCCFTLTNCLTGVTLVTNTPLTSYLDKVIKINEHSGCFIISPNSTANCPGAISVTVSDFYDTCPMCMLVCYLLIDCADNGHRKHTTTDLSGYTGKIIKISGYAACWYVVAVDMVEDIESVVLENSFETCEECS